MLTMLTCSDLMTMIKQKPFRDKVFQLVTFIGKPVPLIHPINCLLYDSITGVKKNNTSSTTMDTTSMTMQLHMTTTYMAM